MTHRVAGIPDDSSVVMPRLVCTDPGVEIDFCTRVLGAIELAHRPGPDGEVVHALLQIGPAMIMIESEWPTLPSKPPPQDGSSPVVIFVYVQDVDQTVARAVELGARILVPLQNQFWGDRIAWLMDPAGHVWTVGSRIEDTTAEQRAERWEEVLKSESSTSD